jgi:hypothetical protein
MKISPLKSVAMLFKRQVQIRSNIVNTFTYLGCKIVCEEEKVTTSDIRRLVCC